MIPTIRQNVSDTGYHHPILRKVGYRIISFRLTTPSRSSPQASSCKELIVENPDWVSNVILNFSVGPLFRNPHSGIENREIKMKFSQVRRSFYKSGKRNGEGLGLGQVIDSSAGREASKGVQGSVGAHHRRRRNAAVLRVPCARFATRRQDPRNHARGPRWRTRS